MPSDNYIISLDVGTQYIKASALSVSDQTIIYGVLEQSNGITREGRIIPGDLGEAIKNIISKLEQKIELKIQSSFVCIPNEQVRLIPTEGHSNLMGGVVTPKELREAQDGAKRVFNRPDEEVVDLIVSKIFVDDTLYHAPLGVKGDRISIYGHVVLVQKEFVESLQLAMSYAGIKISGMGLASEGAASLLLTKKDLRDGVVLVDVGASSTRITLYANREIQDFQWIKIGGKNITKDISIVMEETLLDAEKMKKLYGRGERNLTEERANLLEQVIKARITEVMFYVDDFVNKHENFTIGKVICYGGGLCGFINIQNLYKTNLKQSTNFMTSDIIRDDTVLHIQSGGIAYRLLESAKNLDKNETFTNVVEGALNNYNYSNQAMGYENTQIDSQGSSITMVDYDEDYDEDDDRHGFADNKFVIWIKSIIQKIKNK